jgi:hypothetical protein
MLCWYWTKKWEYILGGESQRLKLRLRCRVGADRVPTGWREFTGLRTECWGSWASSAPRGSPRASAGSRQIARQQLTSWLVNSPEKSLIMDLDPLTRYIDKYQLLQLASPINYIWSSCNLVSQMSIRAADCRHYLPVVAVRLASSAISASSLALIFGY